MTPASLPPIAVGVALALLNARPEARATQQQRSESGGLLWLRAPSAVAVYLRPLEVEIGSSEEEVLQALLRCKREPLAERCDETTFASEVPVHPKKVAGFWISRCEVTVAEYERCVAFGRCRPAAYEGGAERFRQPTYPVTMVSFDDAVRYCASVGGRVPTEVEFERAARGAARRAYPWGRTFNGRLANHGRLGVDPTDASDGFVELAPVGSFPSGATPEGVLDLAGNAEEWTADAFSVAHGLPPTAERVVRGGHFASAASWLRGAARLGKPADTREPMLGFRCVWPLSPFGN